MSKPKQFKVEIVRINWYGPCDFDSIPKSKHKNEKGIYQIYMTHPIFGRDTLSYIGMTIDQDFQARFAQHWKGDGLALRYESQVVFYMGVVDEEDKGNTDEEFSRLLIDLEALSIFRHQPPGNSSGLLDLLVKRPIIVQNFGNYGDFLHEFTSFRMPSGETTSKDFKAFEIET